MNEFRPLPSTTSMLPMPQAGRKLDAIQVPRNGSDQSDADLQRASEQFESLLLNVMIREMRATVPESTLLPRSMAQEIFTGMLDERIAGEMSRQGGIGISRMIFNQLQRGK